MPVCRYALAYWAPAPYLAVVCHRGPLAPTAATALGELQQAAADDSPAPVNLQVEIVDLATAEGAAVWAGYGLATPQALPRLLLLAPPAKADAAEQRRLVSSEPLDAEHVAALLSSPGRRELVRQLLAGAACVWVLVDGSTPEDEAAATRLAAALKEAGKLLVRPPAATATNPTMGAAPPANPKPLFFATVRIARDDPRERMFLSLLLAANPELAERQDQPLAFPVYGRGRVLPGYAGADIAAPQVLETAAFVTGDCACEVKDAAPGVDLLLAARWADALPAEDGQVTAPPLTSMLPTPLAASAEVRPRAGGGRAEPGPPRAAIRSSRRMPYYVGGALLVLLAVVAVAAHRMTPKGARR